MCNEYQGPHKIQRFGKLQAQDPESNQVVKNAWETSYGDHPMKLDQILHQLANWGRSKYGNIPKKIKVVQNTLAKLKNKVPSRDTIIQIKATEEALDDILKQEELWWAQRAKAHWLKDGDLNSKYFRQKAKRRKRKNTIHTIRDPAGNTQQDRFQIKTLFSNHFKNNFTSSDTHTDPDIFTIVQNRVSKQDYDILNNHFTSQEVQEAIINLKANSPPSPDGLSALFYKKILEYHRC